MRHRPRLVLSALLTVLASACDDPSQRGQAVAVQNLRLAVDSLRKELREARAQASFDRTLRSMEGTAFLSPGDDGYSVIRSELGLLTVSLRDVQPYANGSRITLQLGNLTAATITGLKARVEWGSTDSLGLPREDTRRGRDIAPNEALRAGAWTNIHVVAEGIPPSGLGFVHVSQVTHTGIRLNN